MTDPRTITKAYGLLTDDERVALTETGGPWQAYNGFDWVPLPDLILCGSAWTVRLHPNARYLEDAEK